MKNKNIKNINSKIVFLNSSLKNYGLKPNEWVVKHESDNVYKIQNTETPDFYFEGRTSKQGDQETWKKIYLKSI